MFDSFKVSRLDSKCSKELNDSLEALSRSLAIVEFQLDDIIANDNFLSVVEDHIKEDTIECHGMFLFEV